MVDDKVLDNIAALAADLCTLMEIHYLPEHCEDIFPSGCLALRDAQLILGKANRRVPEQVDHWVGKLNASRRH